MKRVALIVMLLSMLAWASDVACPYHPYANCWPTGQVKYIGGSPYMTYHCGCGDNVLVKQ
jgi:hypothetical protein